MSSPFDTTDEIILARECVAKCRRKSRGILYCLLAFALCAALQPMIGGKVMYVGLGTLIVSVCFACATIFHGAEYLLKYRRSKQGMCSVLCRTTFGALWLLLILFGLLSVPKVSSELNSGMPMAEVANAKQLGLMLFVYASDNDGKYPDDLAAFGKTEYITDKKLLYKKGSEELRWILTPGLTTSDDTGIILLRSVEKFKSKNTNREGVVIYTLGQAAEFVRDPDRRIILINGKPALR